MHPLLPLAAAGLAAGTLNAFAGGGSFVTLPALIASGLPGVAANATSTVALFPGGLASAWAWRDGLGPVGHVGLRPLLAATLAGGAAGALLLLATPGRVFDHVLPWLLLAATLALAFGARLGDALRRRVAIRPGALLAVQFLLGLYGGYFGGAVGIMMLAAWGLLDGRGPRDLMGMRMVLVSGANAMAVALFAALGAVRWPQALTLMAGATLGGWLGALVGKRLPAALVRGLTLALTAAITAAFFLKAGR